MTLSVFFFKKKKLQKKNAILLVFQSYEDAIQPSHSSPARFRFQGGYPERDTVAVAVVAGVVVVAGKYFPFLILG
jgi:hypothetical protein